MIERESLFFDRPRVVGAQPDDASISVVDEEREVHQRVGVSIKTEHGQRDKGGRCLPVVDEGARGRRDGRSGRRSRGPVMPKSRQSSETRCGKNNEPPSLDR